MQFGSFGGGRRSLQVILNIGGEEQIQVPVAIIVDECTTRTPARRSRRRRQPRPLRYIGEGSIAVVAIEFVLTVVRTEQVLKAIVVVIADTYSHSPPGREQAGLLCDICKGSVAIVLVETVAGIRRSSVQPHSRQHKDIHPAIVVIVDEGTAAAVCFEDVLLVIDAPIDGWKCKARTRGHIHERSIERTP